VVTIDCLLASHSHSLSLSLNGIIDVQKKKKLPMKYWLGACETTMKIEVIKVRNIVIIDGKNKKPLKKSGKVGK
jgi:hypothetical protein